jgi:hypothetical protein
MVDAGINVMHDDDNCADVFSVVVTLPLKVASRTATVTAP